MFSADVESFNYDYLPGEPQSRRTWYITLRRPVDDQQLQRGMYLKFDTSGHPNTLIPDSRIFRVEDIYGRNVVVVPISDADGNPGGLRLTNVDEHFIEGNQTPYIYQYHPVVYGRGITHPRMGREMYASRPMAHNSTISRIIFPVAPVF